VISIVNELAVDKKRQFGPVKVCDGGLYAKVCNPQFDARRQRL